jgi:hypothetical protein
LPCQFTFADSGWKWLARREVSLQTANGITQAAALCGETELEENTSLSHQIWHIRPGCRVVNKHQPDDSPLSFGVGLLSVGGFCAHYPGDPFSGPFLTPVGPVPGTSVTTQVAADIFSAGASFLF